MSTDALRRDVRLLGAVLGEVLVEQEDQELLGAVERIRRGTRAARAGESPRLWAILETEIAGLPLDRQAAVLRAFAVYFQLANLAEQHHRTRRRRSYGREGKLPRESLAAAFERLDDAGVSAAELRPRPRTSRSSSSSRPTRPRRRGAAS